MIERDKGLTRREILKKGSTVLFLWLAGCGPKLIESIPTETIPHQELEEKEELLSGLEIQRLFPFHVGNLSSYHLEGLRHAPLEEAMKDVKVIPGHFLGITLEDDLECSGRPEIRTTLSIYKMDEEGEIGYTLASVGVTQCSSAIGLTEEERFSYTVTIAFRTLIAALSYLQPYMEDGELTEEEFLMFQLDFEKAREGIEAKIVEELESGRSEPVFIFTPPTTEA